MELEHKAVESGHEIKRAFEDFLGSFEDFKHSNDERLKSLERRSADVLSEEKVARIDAHLTETRQKIDALMLAQARPHLSGERAFDPAGAERKARFDRYVRKGDGGDLEVKALSEGSNADGGYTVPLEIERTIDRVLSQASPIRAIASVRAIGGAGECCGSMSAMQVRAALMKVALKFNSNQPACREAARMGTTEWWGGCSPLFPFPGEGP